MLSSKGFAMLKSVRDLTHIVKTIRPKRMAVVFAHDDLVIDAIHEAANLGVIKPILIGDKDKILSIIREKGCKGSPDIIDCTDPDAATKIAMDLVNNKSVEIVMKGLIDTKILLKGVVNKEYGIRSYPLLSHVGLVSIPGYPRVLFASDGAMNIQPTVEEKRLIIENAVLLAHTLGYSKPKVGLVSAVEKINPKIQSTVEAGEIVAYYRDNPPSDFLIDGPFAIDNLVSPESVRHKGIQSEVAGECDILIFPNLDGGNIFYKTTVFLANGISAGLIIGAKVPIVLTSRADSAEAKLYSILLAVVNQDGLLATNH